ncbi:MAG: helix-turn-helix domain-containing protein [Arenicellales bacterium]|jgi:predicted site-specific integrase-resolvase|nr:helix-turn-helix domain-containing protein [Arenicellales bacterium]HJP44875.1 helix-turn-helix domain-containing protein [Arenicellales bacterium]|tara:strand:+ start:454 stop:654 length:201 start_codon:yes stop_codon:yes gene_type:complete
MNEYQALMTQRELCNRWRVSEATLERWRSEGIGPIYVKLGGQVRYRREDVLEYEASCLRKSTFEAV